MTMLDLDAIEARAALVGIGCGFAAHASSAADVPGLVAEVRTLRDMIQIERMTSSLLRSSLARIHGLVARESVTWPNACGAPATVEEQAP